MHLSRRSFLALSAVAIVGCSSADDEANDATTDVPTDPPTTDPPSEPSPSPSDAPSTASTTTGTTVPAVALPADPFTLGVASGDPDGSSVVLWTRLTGELPTDGIDVEWEITSAAGDQLAVGTVRAETSTGGAVHVVAPLSEPAIYRFRAGGFESPGGRASPLGGSEAAASVRLASASCQHYETGFYAAHRDIAEWQPDLVVFLGDFIYEGASNPVGDGRVRSHEGPEPSDVEAYRTRYATYLSDHHLQASRAACPWLVIWDDHEVENNYAGLVPQDPADAAEFESRRAMAYQAWWEHMPTRLPPPDPGRDDYPIYRSVDIGDLVAISAVDGRQYRSDQVCTSTLDVGPPCSGWDDPTRTMLGTEQETWLAGRFSSTTSRWNCVAQQTVMTDLRVAGTGGILNYDQWDGYAPARDRTLGAAPADLVVLTGDIHLAGVGLLGDPTGVSPTGVEFVTASISSDGNVPPELQPVLAAYPNVVDAELTKRGYIRHTITLDDWTAEFRTVDDAADPDSAVSTWKSFVVDRGRAAVNVVR